MVGALDFEAGNPGREYEEIYKRILRRSRRLREATRTYELDRELRADGFDPKLINEGLNWLKQRGLVRVKQLGAYEVLAPAGDMVAHPSPWLTLEEAAEYLRVSPRTIHTWVKEGRLVGHQAGPRGVLRFRREDLDASLVPTSVGATAINGQEDPVLTEMWDNESDAIYDED